MCIWNKYIGFCCFDGLLILGGLDTEDTIRNYLIDTYLESNATLNEELITKVI